jgi:hypothetical protein
MYDASGTENSRNRAYDPTIYHTTDCNIKTFESIAIFILCEYHRRRRIVFARTNTIRYSVHILPNGIDLNHSNTLVYLIILACL